MNRANAQGKWAAFAALLTSLGVLSRFAEILGNYLRWFGFRIVPGEMQGWLTVGIVIGASSGVFVVTVAGCSKRISDVEAT